MKIKWHWMAFGFILIIFFSIVILQKIRSPRPTCVLFEVSMASVMEAQFDASIIHLFAELELKELERSTAWSRRAIDGTAYIKMDGLGSSSNIKKASVFVCLMSGGDATLWGMRLDRTHEMLSGNYIIDRTELHLGENIACQGGCDFFDCTKPCRIIIYEPLKSKSIIDKYKIL